MKISQPRAKRPGLTLVELLVVITLIAILATLVVVYVLPAFQDNKNVVRGLDRVTTALLIAKQRALRDQGPRGVRFIHSGGICNELQYIEQPDPLSQGNASSDPTNKKIISFTGANLDLYGGAVASDPASWLVQPGDYFQSRDGEIFNYRIANVAPLQIEVSRDVDRSFTNTPRWRIIRQARPITSEETVKLPQNVVVDLAHMSTISGNNQMATRTVGTVTYFEILFSPAGGVLDRMSTIVLWVRNEESSPGGLDASQNYLLAINPRTGGIASHPINPSGATAAAVIQYATDGKASGL